MSEDKWPISGDDLGLLLWCATGYDRRLKDGHVPAAMWEMLPQKWRDKINGIDGDPRWEERPRT